MQALQTLYTDRCDVYGFTEVLDSAVTRHQPVCITRDVPCRVSYLRGGTSREEYILSAEVGVKVFLPPDVEILPGARVDVRGRSYACAGLPLVFDTHQEVCLMAREEA